MGVSSKIKQVRLERNFSQDYVASQLKISQSYYAKIEKGKTELTFSKLVQLSEIFNITPTHLFEKLLFEYNSHTPNSILIATINNNNKK